MVEPLDIAFAEHERYMDSLLTRYCNHCKERCRPDEMVTTDEGEKACISCAPRCHWCGENSSRYTEVGAHTKCLACVEAEKNEQSNV